MALFDTKKKLRHNSKGTSPTGAMFYHPSLSQHCPHVAIYCYYTNLSCTKDKTSNVYFDVFTTKLPEGQNGSLSEHLADVCVSSYPSSINTKWRHTKKDCLSLYQGKSPFALYFVEFTKGILRPIKSKRWREIEIEHDEIKINEHCL